MSFDAIGVAIVEDDRATRQGLAFLIGGTEGFLCRGEYRSVEHALAARPSPPPHVILLDIHLPGISGPEGIPLLREKYPAVQIIMLTVHEGSELIFESICNGACGYLLKKTPPAKLLESIREAYDGGAPMSPQIARRAVELFRRYAPPTQADYHLTPRERDVLGLLAEGHSYSKLAEMEGISVNTVRNYIRSIYEKLHVHSRSEAVSKALRGRLI